jgi:hypothetical protein
MQRSRQKTASWTVRVSADADQKRTELQERTGLTARELIERGLAAFEAELDRQTSEQAPAAAP